MKPGLLHFHRWKSRPLSYDEQRDLNLTSTSDYVWYVSRCRCGESKEPVKVEVPYDIDWGF